MVPEFGHDTGADPLVCWLESLCLSLPPSSACVRWRPGRTAQEQQQLYSEWSNIVLTYHLATIAASVSSGGILLLGRRPLSLSLLIYLISPLVLSWSFASVQASSLAVHIVSLLRTSLLSLSGLIRSVLSPPWVAADRR